MDPGLAKREPSSDEQPSDNKPSNPLADAQKARANALMAANMAKFGNIAGAGIARVNPLPADTFNSIAQQGALKVQDYQEQVANQKNDPNSPMSQTVRQYMESKGIKVPEDASASDILTVAPYMQKDAGLQNAIQKVILQGKIKQDVVSQQQEAANAREQAREKAALERTQLNNQGRTQAMIAAQGAKQGKEQRDASVKAENDLNSTRGKQALMMAQRNLMSAKNAEQMLKEFPDPDKWTSQQVALFNSEIGKIATGGVPTEGQLSELNNPTAAKSISNFASKLTNVPVGAEQGQFIKLNAKYLSGLKDVSQATIRDNTGNVLKSYQDKLSPEGYKNLLYRHSDALGLFTPAQEKGINAVMQAKGLSRQDAIKALVQEKVIKDVNY